MHSLGAFSKTGSLVNVSVSSGCQCVPLSVSLDVAVDMPPDACVHAVHTRMGSETEDRSDGTFQPTGVPSRRHWVLVAYTIRSYVILKASSPGLAGDQWSCRLEVPQDIIVQDIKFYGDDGKSSLFPGNGEEGRQKIGLLVVDEDAATQEIWLFEYDDLPFQQGDSAVLSLQRRVSDDEVLADGVVFCRSRSINTTRPNGSSKSHCAHANSSLCCRPSCCGGRTVPSYTATKWIARCRRRLSSYTNGKIGCGIVRYGGR